MEVKVVEVDLAVEVDGIRAAAADSTHEEGVEERRKAKERRDEDRLL